MMMRDAYMRLSLVQISKGSKRPEVCSYQAALAAAGYYSGKVDGWFGKGTHGRLDEVGKPKDGLIRFQADNGLRPDGIIGPRTATVLLRQVQAAGWRPNPIRQIQALIAWYETGSTQDAYGMSEPDIGDGAGANYGVVQHNSFGSVEHLLKLAGEDLLLELYRKSDKKVPNQTLQSWFGSVPGIAAQNRYFSEVIVQVAKRQMKDLPELCKWKDDPELYPYWERALLLFCDTVVQNGSMWSSYSKPFWVNTDGVNKYGPRHNLMELYTGEWWDQLLSKYIPYEELKSLWLPELKRQEVAHPGDTKTAMRETNKALCRRIMEEKILISDPVSKLVLLAQWRARTSSPAWWYIAVAPRRMLDATGHGTVNGGEIDLVLDYRLGVPRDAPQSPATTRDTFIESEHADLLADAGID